MTEGLPIYFPKDLYHKSKVGLKGIFETFGLEWNPDPTIKAWVSKCCKVAGVFEGHKKPALLYVTGSNAFIEQMKEFAKYVGAEIRESEVPAVKDIRDKRKEEAEQKRLETERQKQEEERIKIVEIDKKREVELSLLHVVENKVSYAKLLKLSDKFIVDWLKKELGVDICFYYDDKEIQQVKVAGFDVPKINPFVAPKNSKEIGADYEDSESGDIGTVVTEQVVVKKIAAEQMIKTDVAGEISILCKENRHTDCRLMGIKGCVCVCHYGAKS